MLGKNVWIIQQFSRMNATDIIFINTGICIGIKLNNQ